MTPSNRVDGPSRGRRGRTPTPSLSAADGADPLGPDDLERLATAAYLIGRDDSGADVGARAHHEFLRRGQVERAVRCAFWMGFSLIEQGDEARGGGWLARGRRLLDDAQLDCVEQGYLLFPGSLQALMEGDVATAGANFDEVTRIGGRFGDPDLLALGRLGLGAVRLAEGRRPVAWPCWTRP